ncbi:MAG TPA: type II CAAX endopeptidase family protein [Terriglobales bacterium]|jgi:membrane protease YdiL (CAAX protease family)|nr:type II CAAX endopeptidase family protein [Terriglobales bacterium]
MLFYIKRYLSLEITITLLLGGVGYWGIQSSGLPLALKATRQAIFFGITGFAWLAVWTGLVQQGYAVVKGKTYAQNLTAALAKEFAHAGPAQIIVGGLTAACGEEIFFRGFLQQKFGLIAASLLFMVAHFGKKDIRIISVWSVFQGLYLGLFFAWSRSLLVPMIAHGLFDIGGMIYFRGFMTHRARAA